MGGLDLSTFDPGTLDFAAVSSSDVLALAERYHQRGNHGYALQVVEGEIADLERDAPANQAMLSLLHGHAADGRRVLRRFEDALASLERSERCLETCVSALDPALAKNRPLLDWAGTQRCSHIGLRGWLQQDWGALDAARASFELERAELERLAERGVDVSRIRADSDQHLANLAMLTGAPERIEALLRELPADPAGPARMRPYLLLRLAGARREQARREGTPATDVRAALEVALAEEALDPIDRVFGELWLADLELDEGRLTEARALWSSAGARLEELDARGSRAQRRWVGVGARIAASAGGDERGPWLALLTEEIDAFLAEWRALDSREGGYGLLHVDDSLRLFCELTELSLALEGEEAGARSSFEALNRAHAESALARRLGASVPSLQELRDALCARAPDGVLVYLAGPLRSWVFVLDRDRLQALPLADAYRVERSRRRLVQELLAHHGSWSAAAREATRDLGELLLPAPVRAWMTGRTALAVCGLDLFLGEVPFELLDLGDGRRVGLEWAVCNLPPLAVSVALARRAASVPRASAGLQLLAGPVLAPEVVDALGFPGFTLEVHDVDGIVRPFPAGACDVFLGADAHAGALSGGTRAVLQLLVHGTWDETRSRGAELALAPSGSGDDGLLSTADVQRIFGERMAARLVVLTACRAGRGVQRRGDAGASDLAGAFLGCGAQGVVLSSFDLDLPLAAEMSAQLYEGLARGADVGEALRRARVELARDPRFADSAQPLLLRAVGLQTPPVAAWLADDGGLPRAAVLWSAGALALVLFCCWAVRLRARQGR